MRPHIFLDMDGVLADFDRHFEDLFGVHPRTLPDDDDFWMPVARTPRFFAELPLMPDAAELYEGVRRLHPTILSGAPSAIPSAEEQKREWAARFFPGVPVITCLSREKVRHLKSAGDVLIDDWPKHMDVWRAAGGVFILHASARQSLGELFSLYPELEPALR